MIEKEEKTCGSCTWNDNCLCDQCGRIITDEDPACNMYEDS